MSGPTPAISPFSTTFGRWRERIARRFDAPEVLINNAGYAVYYTFEQTPSGGNPSPVRCQPRRRRAGDARVSSRHDPRRRRPHCHDGVDRRPDPDDAVRRVFGVEARSRRPRRASARSRPRASTCSVHVVCPGRVETDFFSHESFKTRAHRPETARTIPIEAVSRAVMAAVERNRFMTYVPWYYGVLAWLAAAAAASCSGRSGIG